MSLPKRRWYGSAEKADRGYAAEREQTVYNDGYDERKTKVSF